MIDDQDEGLARVTDLDVTWGFGLLACLQERSLKPLVAVDAGDGTTETMDWSQGGAVDVGPGRDGRNRRDVELVPRGRSRRLPGPGRGARKRFRRIAPPALAKATA